MFIIESLPRAGTPLLYRFNGGKWHRATIDSGLVFTWCFMQRRPNPSVDEFSTNVIPYQGQAFRCQKCR